MFAFFARRLTNSHEKREIRSNIIKINRFIREKAYGGENHVYFSTKKSEWFAIYKKYYEFRGYNITMNPENGITISWK